MHDCRQSVYRCCNWYVAYLMSIVTAMTRGACRWHYGSMAVITKHPSKHIRVLNLLITHYDTPQILDH